MADTVEMYVLHRFVCTWGLESNVVDHSNAEQFCGLAIEHLGQCGEKRIPLVSQWKVQEAFNATAVTQWQFSLYNCTTFIEGNRHWIELDLLDATYILFYFAAIGRCCTYGGRLEQLTHVLH